MSRTYEQLEPVISALDNRISAKAEQIDALDTRVTAVEGDVSDLKEDFTQMESDGVVPSAEQILSDKGVTDSVPYHYRKTGGDGADRLYDQIVGGTVALNQLAKPVTSDYWIAENNVSVAFTDSVATFTSQATSNGIKSNAQKQVAASHVYYMGFSFQSGSASTITCLYGGNGGARVLFTSETSMTGVYKIAKADASASGSNIYLYPASNGVNVEHKVKNVMLIDITAMFGTTIADYIYQLEQSTEGAGVAWLKSHFSRIFNAGYIPYNAGELVSVQASAHKMTGFNQWDEEWELGNINSSTGQDEANNSVVRSKGYISATPSTEYYVATSEQAVVFFYDSSKNFIDATTRGNQTFSTPPNASYIRFRASYNYGSTYKNDICINLSDPAKNGTYEPYEEHSYPLDSTLTLRGIPKLDVQNNLYYDGDTYESDGTVTRRYGIITLVGGSEAVYSSNGISSIASHGFVKIADKAFGQYNMVSDKFITARTGQDFIGKMNGRDSTIGIEFSLPLTVEATNDAVKAWFAENPTTVVYELATPTTEQADPYISPQICDPNGTEEFVSTGIVPVGHETRYPENLRAKIEGLPWDFSSLIAPTEKSTTASRNYTIGNLLIMGNVLYKVTANIANGGTITPNTNVTATTLSEILSALAQ